MTEIQIEEKVNAVFEETGLISIPVEVVSMANLYGFEVYELEMDSNTSGIIIIDTKPIKNFDSEKVIVVNSDHSKARKRFTIAHELGHYILRGKPTTCYAHRDSSENYDSDEKDANSFASALLMPKEDIIRYANSEQEDLNGEMIEFLLIAKVAKRYNVSQSAAEVRLKKLGII